MAALICLCLWSQSARAESRLPEDAQQTFAEVEKAIPVTREDYEGLRLRNRIEPFRDKLHPRLTAMEPRRENLKKEAEKLGPKPASDEPPALAAQRARHVEVQKTFDERSKQIEVLAQRADHCGTG